MLLDVLDEVRMRTLPPDVRMLWLDIARMMQRDGISVFRFGSEILKPSGLSRLISRPETETETELETKITELCARGLLGRESDGAISCPLLASAATRSEINRANGVRGGRPRKDAPREQTALMLPIDGGKKARLAEPEARAPASPAVQDDFAARVVTAAGFAAGWRGDRAIIGKWIAAGADEALILDVVRDKAGAHVFSLAYFSGAIEEAVEARPRPRERWEREYDRAYDMWVLLRVGPFPEAKDFKAKFGTANGVRGAQAELAA